MAKLDFSQSERDAQVLLSHNALETAESLMAGLRSTHRTHLRLTERIRELKSALDCVYVVAVLRLSFA